MYCLLVTTLILSVTQGRSNTSAPRTSLCAHQTCHRGLLPPSPCSLPCTDLAYGLLNITDQRSCSSSHATKPWEHMIVTAVYDHIHQQRPVTAVYDHIHEQRPHAWHYFVPLLFNKRAPSGICLKWNILKIEYIVYVIYLIHTVYPSLTHSVSQNVLYARRFWP